MSDLFRQKLEEVQRQSEEEAWPMEFAGFPCEAFPLPYIAFVQSGRMPDSLASIVLEDDAQAQSAKVKALTPEEQIEGEAFKRFAVCRVLKSPRVVEKGTPPTNGYLYSDLVLTAPKFITGVFQWILLGCPKPKQEKGGGVLGRADLEKFSSGKKRGQRARARSGSKGKRTKAVGTSASD